MDDSTKRLRESITSHVRARLRDGAGMRQVLDELLEAVTETVNKEVLRQLDQLDPSEPREAQQ